MFRGATIFAVVWITLAVLYQQYFVPHFGDEVRRPPVPQAEAFRPEARGTGPLLPPSRRAPPELNEVAEVKMDLCPSSCAGTAFALDRGGLWMTARHVVEGCQRVVILAGRGLDATHVHLHPRADVALIRTDRGAPALALAGGQRGAGEDGFGFGFPAGEPGAAHGRLLGRLRMRATGSVRYTAPITAWAELSRSPLSAPRLQGISGGPLLDAAGNVVGVMVASSKRRGRFYGAAIPSLDEMIDRAGVEVHRAPTADTQVIAAGSYPSFGQRLRAETTVAQVGCLRDGRGRRRPLESG